jgi:hypothetical protein
MQRRSAVRIILSIGRRPLEDPARSLHDTRSDRDTNAGDSLGIETFLHRTGALHDDHPYCESNKDAVREPPETSQHGQNVAVVTDLRPLALSKDPVDLLQTLCEIRFLTDAFRHIDQ